MTAFGVILANASRTIDERLPSIQSTHHQMAESVIYAWLKVAKRGASQKWLANQEIIGFIYGQDQSRTPHLYAAAETMWLMVILGDNSRGNVINHASNAHSKSNWLYSFIRGGFGRSWAPQGMASHGQWSCIVHVPGCYVGDQLFDTFHLLDSTDDLLSNFLLHWSLLWVLLIATKPQVTDTNHQTPDEIGSQPLHCQQCHEARRRTTKAGQKPGRNFLCRHNYKLMLSQTTWNIHLCIILNSSPSCQHHQSTGTEESCVILD